MLEAQHVELDDNFFELGGDSMRSMQIAARAIEAGISISAVQVFDHPTVRELATVADLEVPPAEIAEALEGLNHPGPLSDAEVETLAATLIRSAAQSWRRGGAGPSA